MNMNLGEGRHHVPQQPSLAQFEHWILHANHPENASIRRQSVEALQQWTNTTPPSVGFPLLLQLYQESSHMAVKFQVLTVLALHPYVQDSSEQCAYYRNILRTCILQRPSDATSDSPSILRNKKAQLLGAHMIHDHAWWTTMEKDLEHLASNTTSSLLFLHTLRTVLDEFQTVSVKQQNRGSATSGSLASVADNRTTIEQTRRLKEVLKGYHDQQQHPSNGTSKSTLLERMFDLTVRTFESSPGNVEIATTALETITSFFRWTDVSFLGARAVARCFDVLLQTLLQKDQLEMQVAAIQAWGEYTSGCTTNTTQPTTTGQHTSDAIAPPMDLALVARLLQQIHISQYLPYPQQPGQKSTEAANVDGDTMELVIGMANVVNNVGMALLLAENPTESAIWSPALDLFLRCWAYDDIDVTLTVVPMALRIVPILASQQQLPLFLNTLYEQMKYPADFGYNFSEDDDAEEEMFRIELSKVYDKLVLTSMPACLQFLCEAVNVQFVGNAAAIPTPAAEATLRLVYRFCDGVRPRPGLQTILQNDTFRNLLFTIHKSNIAQHPHGHVLCLYYEIVVRYAPIFTSRKDPQSAALLLPIFDSMTTGGLQHSDARVRSRCCYLLSRLVNATLDLLSPVVESSLGGIQRFLEQNYQTLLMDDILFLYETMGLLIAKTRQEKANQQRYLVAALLPVLQSMDRSLEQGGTVEVEILYESMTVAIAAVAYISKGFRRPFPAMQEVFGSTLPTVLRVLEKGSTNDELRNKTMIYLQRMVQCKANGLLSYMGQFLGILVAKATSDDVLFVSQLVSNVCSSFTTEAFPVINAVVLPFLHRCEALIVENQSSSNVEDEAPHVETETMRIQKIMFSVLQHIVSKNLSSVLVSEQNLGSFAAILELVSRGACEHMEASTRKGCIRFFLDLTLQWIVPSQPEGVSNQQCELLLKLVSQRLLPEFLTSILTKPFDINDANNVRLLSEFCALADQLRSNAKTNATYGSCIALVIQVNQAPEHTYQALVDGVSCKQDMVQKMQKVLVQTNRSLGQYR